MKEKDRKNRQKKTSEEQIDIIDLNLQTNSRKDGRPDTLQRNRGSEEIRKKPADNREFVRVTYLFVGLFLCLMGYLVYFNLIEGREIINSPYNVRLDSMADRVVRGKILDRNGKVLAETQVAEDGTETRNYPYGDMFAHVVGYDSHGKSGIESTENFNLLTSHAFFVEKFMKEFREEKNIGDNVITTLDVNLQEAAYNALGTYKGAVVVLEVSTGKILSMVSKPDFNPNTLSEDWEKLTNSEESVLLNRATQGAYAPGSVFKLVTTLAYMRENENYASYEYFCEGEVEHKGTVIHCAKNRKHESEDLLMSLANSCNTSYCNIGLSLKYSNFEKAAKDLLFDSKLPCIFPHSQSKFRLTKDSSDAEVMMTAIGQGKTQVSPYHMALVASTVANGGILMEPYAVEQIVSYTGSKIEKRMPSKYGELLSSAEASQIKEYMKAVVDGGTGSALKNDKYTVAGKTGTAEYSSDKEKAHSWFVGFTNLDNPELAISVVVESADNSGMSAVTVAKKVLNTYYNE